MRNILNSDDDDDDADADADETEIKPIAAEIWSTDASEWRTFVLRQIVQWIRIMVAAFDHLAH